MCYPVCSCYDSYQNARAYTKILQTLLTFILDSSVNLEELERKRIPQAKSAGHLNIRGVYLHILGDALGSIIVMISALIIMFAHGQWTLYVDPSMSIIMVVIILKTSIPLLMETSKILMNSVPHHIQINQMREKLLKQLPQIKNVHELHVWQLAGDKIIGNITFVTRLLLRSFDSFIQQFSFSLFVIWPKCVFTVLI